MKNALILILIAGALTLAFSIGRQTAYKSAVAGLKTKTDTLYVERVKAVTMPENDLVTSSPAAAVRLPLFVPFPVQDSAALGRADSLLARIGKLEVENDSLCLVLQRVQKIYSSEDYTAWVSGIDPALDSLRITVPEKIITAEHVREVAKKTRWGLGVQAGMGAGKNGLTPYVGVGISYNLISW